MHRAERTWSEFALGALRGTLCGLCAVGVIACSRAPAPATSTSSVGAAWAGVYQGPYHLYLRLRVKGAKSIGYWRAIGGRSGRLAGTISGERLEFDWKEEGGGAASWSGRGYFDLRPPHGSLPATIYGEWGLGRNRSGGSWWALKRLDEPTLDDLEDNSRSNDDDPNCPSCGVLDFDDFTR